MRGVAGDDDDLFRHATAAIALDNADPRANCSLALAHFWLGRQAQAVERALSAINLDANMPEAYGVLGAAQAVSGEAEQAIEALERAMKGSPRDPIRWFWCHGMANAQFALGRYEDAIEWAAKTAELRPEWAFSHLVSAASNALLDRPKEARRAADRLLSIVPDYSLKKFRRNPMWAKQDDRERLIAGLKKAGLKD